MTSTELDAELLSRTDPSKFRGISELNETCWFGYRFAHPALRFFAFLKHYQDAYQRTSRLLGMKFMRPAWLKPNPIAGLSRNHFTALLTATFTADAHGIPYDFFLEKLMELHLRGTVHAAPAPNQLYHLKNVSRVADMWAERNVSGIYVAKHPLLHVSAYEGHPIQNAYMDYLCEAISNKGNRPFYIARLMFDIQHLTEERAVAAFGRDMVERAHDRK